MSYKTTAFYYLENYYLLPTEFDTYDAFFSSLTDLPKSVKTKKLLTDCRIPGNIQKGVCIAPYFISDYGFPEVEIEIKDASDAFPVEVEILTQKEYNERIRQVIQNYCPGCMRYKPISKYVQSLNGHFEEISLDSVCFFRQNSKPAPRVLREGLHTLGWFMHDFPPETRGSDHFLQELKTWTHAKLSGGEFTEDRQTYTVSFSPDFITQTVIEATSDYIEKHLDFTKLKLICNRKDEYGIADFEKQIAQSGIDALRKSCKRFGIALAVMTYDFNYSDKIKASMSTLLENDYARAVFENGNKVYLLLLDRNNFMKELHYRFPLLEKASVSVDVFDQEKSVRYFISRTMETINNLTIKTLGINGKTEVCYIQ